VISSWVVARIGHRSYKAPGGAGIDAVSRRSSSASSINVPRSIVVARQPEDFMRRIGISSVALLLLPWIASAGTYNDALNIGDAAPAWKDLPGVDGKKHSFADFADRDVLVVLFTCCGCPAAQDYEDRILAFAKKHGPGSGVGIVAINVNTIPEDRMDKMKQRATEKGFPFPFLYDETQKIGRLYGAMYTPEFFVLDKERKVVYMGAMDDRDNAALVKTHFLEDAVAAALKGQKAAVNETLARGCRIRYPRKRIE
jgi:peroxiredoxin